MAKLSTVIKLILVIMVLALISNIALERKYFSSETKYGMTFSPIYAGYLGLDWQETYIGMLDELKVRDLRIPGYWSVLEPFPGSYDFLETDFMLNEAGRRSARVILVLGLRQPRWPECHVPSWAKQLTLGQRQEKLLEFIQKTVDRYKDRSEIWAWQVENEPMLRNFGEDCDIPSEDFLKREVEVVKKLSNKPIIMTDSGELGFWTTSMQLSDIFGTTVYRKVYDKTLGYVTYPFPAYFYNLKSGFVRKFFADRNRKTIIMELQTEPWLSNGTLMSPELQAKIFTINDFNNYLNYAKTTGFNEAYLWGVEWWYFMNQKGYPEYLEYAKKLFKAE